MAETVEMTSYTVIGYFLCRPDIRLVFQQLAGLPVLGILCRTRLLAHSSGRHNILYQVARVLERQQRAAALVLGYDLEKARKFKAHVVSDLGALVGVGIHALSYSGVCTISARPGGRCKPWGAHYFTCGGRHRTPSRRRSRHGRARWSRGRWSSSSSTVACRRGDRPEWHPYRSISRFSQM